MEWLWWQGPKPSQFQVDGCTHFFSVHPQAHLDANRLLVSFVLPALSAAFVCLMDFRVGAGPVLCHGTGNSSKLLHCADSADCAGSIPKVRKGLGSSSAPHLKTMRMTGQKSRWKSREKQSLSISSHSRIQRLWTYEGLWSLWQVACPNFLFFSSCAVCSRHECFGASLCPGGWSAIVFHRLFGTRDEERGLLLHRNRGHHCLAGSYVNASRDVFRW